MNSSSLRPSLTLLGAASLALAASAQTAAHTATHSSTSAHRATGAAATRSAATPACLTEPTLSPKIPALPAGSPCVKPLYTLTRQPEITLDYVSPMVSPELREGLDAKPVTFSLGYIDTKVGTGELAKPHMWYTVHYTGYLVDGTKFDSSLDRSEPISFPYGQHRVIPGWDTGFEGMHVGGKRRLYVPYVLAYGEKGQPPVIPAKAELIFDVELVAQSMDQPKPKPAPEPAKPATPPPADAAKPATPPPADAAKPAQPATPPPASTTPKQ